MTVLDLMVPILVATVATWFCSFLAWAVSKHHNGDRKALPPEAAAKLTALIKEHGVQPGEYMTPHMFDPAVMKDPAAMETIKAGQAGLLTVLPNPNMGRNMLLTVVVFLFTNFLVGYLASFSVPAGADFLSVWRFTGAAGVLAYTFAFLPNGIWFGQSGRSMAMNMLDGVLFGLASGAVFAAMWPAAVV